ncbi:glycosyl hydrolase family 76-domain-containing protein [Xylaria bambusicola]|uniref:glycosyl hydrolase family 76-domain-containing protein n=1 Tax=Xylaria bambusicola TaxID=326684 RepID=UPI002008DEC5|nr:glycosyl hydrolase family 76-domain-containing protein [Xylaria bambusicola]KAI0515457.1 glycosyl hydrolase family 76-domain-containing protein [Xylaria bambusicola]
MAQISSRSLIQFLLSATGVFAGLTVDVDDAASIKKAAAIVAEDLMSYYTGDIPGILPGPPPEGDYYWWTGGALWTSLLDYRSRTNDNQYDDKISEGLLFQRGESDDYLPANWTLSIGNDDQAIWAMAALLAAETGFTDPAERNLKSWISLAQNVYNQESDPSRRVSNGSCEGALRWQIYRTNNGYNYIATSASAAYANLGARLSVWNGNNETQAKSVEDTFDWLQDVNIIDDKFNVFDGAMVPDCDSINKLQFSHNAALFLESAAVMYNSTNGDEKWKTLVDGLLKRTIDVFFPDGVATEVSCELTKTTCTTDMTFYKFFLHRSLAATMRIAPYTESKILPALKSSAAAAVTSCVGGKNGRMCGLDWSGNSDDLMNAGSQMSVLSALLSLLPVEKLAKPGSETSGTTTPTPTDTASGQSTTSTVPDNLGTHIGVSFVALLGALSASFVFN